MTRVFSNFPEPFSRKAVSHLDITSHSCIKKIQINGKTTSDLSNERKLKYYLGLRLDIVFQVLFDWIVTEQSKARLLTAPASDFMIESAQKLFNSRRTVETDNLKLTKIK